MFEVDVCVGLRVRKQLLDYAHLLNGLTDVALRKTNTGSLHGSEVPTGIPQCINQKKAFNVCDQIIRDFWEQCSVWQGIRCVLKLTIYSFPCKHICSF